MVLSCARVLAIMKPRFYFATGQVGAEKVIKTEVLLEFSQLKFAFSRPGFITFKEDDDRKAPINRTHGIFTRLWGQTLGQAKDQASLMELLETVPHGAILHTFERDQFLPGDEPKDFIFNARVSDCEQILKNSFTSNGKPRFRLNAVPQVGQQVFDLIWIDDQHLFLGTHTHGSHLDPSPGNQPKIVLPPTAPARSYLKIVEAVHRYQPKLEKGMRVLEIGCSPGGATTAMIAMGLKVTGVDPKYMHSSVYSLPEFSFIQKPAKDLTDEELDNTNPDWLVMDMNIAPLEAIDELGHVLGCLRRVWDSDIKLKYGFLTLKLNDWKFTASIPLYLRRIRELGFQNLVSTQLCSNRQEFFVMASGFRS